MLLLSFVFLRAIPNDASTLPQPQPIRAPVVVQLPDPPVRSGSNDRQLARQTKDRVFEPAVSSSPTPGPSSHVQQPVAIPEHVLYPNSMLDQTLRRFIELVDPASLSLLDSTPLDPSIDRPTLQDWPLVFTDEQTTVATHPVNKSLYAVSTSFPDIDLRKLWELLISIDVRSTWDSMCEQTVALEHIGDQATPVHAVTGREGTVDYLAIKGMFPVKAKDMVLLSCFGQLGAKANAVAGSISQRRLVCATTSVVCLRFPLV